MTMLKCTKIVLDFCYFDKEIEKYIMRDGKSLKVVMGEEKEKIKSMTGEQLWEYFKNYYMRTSLLILVFLIALISIAINYTKNQRQLVLGGMTINIEADDDAYTYIDDGYFDYMGYDKHEQRTNVTTEQYIDVNDSDHGTYNGTIYRPESSLTAQIAAGDLDFVISDITVMNMLNAYEAFIDLRELLTDEQLETLGDRLLYMDDENGESHAIAIDISGTAFTDRFNVETVNSDVYIGIIANAPNMDNMSGYIDYIINLEGEN